MKVKLEYGDGQVEVNVPDNSDIFLLGGRDRDRGDRIRTASRDSFRKPWSSPLCHVHSHPGARYQGQSAFDNAGDLYGTSQYGAEQLYGFKLGADSRNTDRSLCRDFFC